jgi:hypothetical protein
MPSVRTRWRKKGNSTARDRIHGVPGTFAIHRCDGCHAWFIQPWLTVAEIDRYYPDEYGRYRHGQSLKKKQYRRGWQRYIGEPL